MVNILSIVFMIVSMLICFLLPVALIIYFYRKYKISLIAVLLGAIVFFVSQIAIRIPLLSIVGKQQWYIVMKLLMKKSLNWKNGIAFGIGHGGIEAIIIVGLTLLNYIVISMMINSGLFDSAIAATLPPTVAEQIRSTLVDSPTINFLGGGFERTMTMDYRIIYSSLCRSRLNLYY